MGALDGVKAQLLRLEEQGNWWQLMLLYVLLIALWYWLRKCRYSADVNMPVQVAELWVYPVKSCAGIQLPRAVVERGGLQWDRQFAIIKPDGEVLSQKQYPALAAVSPRPVYGRVGELLELVLSSPGGGSVRVDVRTAGDHATTAASPSVSREYASRALAPVSHRCLRSAAERLAPGGTRKRRRALSTVASSAPVGAPPCLVAQARKAAAATEAMAEGLDLPRSQGRAILPTRRPERL